MLHVYVLINSRQREQTLVPPKPSAGTFLEEDAKGTPKTNSDF
jgi:hypothetical protein